MHANPEDGNAVQEKEVRRETMVYREREGVGTLWLNRPERRNALDAEVFGDLLDLLKLAEETPSVRVVVLAATGPVFCAGQNLKMTATAEASEKWQYDRINLEGRERLRKLRKPVIARVQGHALGGGCYLALACDLIVAARPSDFALREIWAGEESGGALLWSVGRARAMEASLLGRRISATEAERWGLINRVVEEDALDSAIKDYATELLNLPPLGLEFTKSSQNALLDAAGLGGHMEMMMVRNRFLFQTADAAEARKAFTEKRPPIFKGQ